MRSGQYDGSPRNYFFLESDYRRFAVIKLMESQSLIEIESLRAQLEDAGISCFIKNQHASTLAGEVPFAEVFPELWLTRDEDFSQAKELLALWKDVSTHGHGWTCDNCKEKHSAQYTECWRCRAVRDQPDTGRALPAGEPDQEQPQTEMIPLFLIGAIVGVVLAVGALSLVHYFRAPAGDVEDRNGDGKGDVTYSYETLSPVAPRRPTSLKTDENFDGVYDTFYTLDRAGYTTRGEIDRDQDGRPDIIEHYKYGSLRRTEFLDKTGSVVKRVFYEMGLRAWEDVDADGDGTFERTIFFDKFESPKPGTQ